jgi:CheY-like chemotaxis protein
MDGLEVCRCLRERSGEDQPLIVAMTGHGQEEDRRRSREAGFDAHLVKPVDFGTLQELLVS